MVDADIIVSAVGIPHFVTREMVEGSFERRKELKSIDEDDRLFIDVGINFKDGKITGDMESEAFKDPARARRGRCPRGRRPVRG